MYQLIFIAIPTLVAAFILFGIQQPASSTHLVAFLAASVIALLVSFLLGYIIALIAFWFMTLFSLEWMLGGLILVFSGTYVPLWFFPEGWATVARCLPFQYLGYIPAAIYTGYFAPDDLMSIIGAGMAWIFILLAIVAWLWNRAMRRMVVQGG